MFFKNISLKLSILVTLSVCFGLISKTFAYPTLPDTIANIFPDPNLAAAITTTLSGGRTTGSIVTQSELNGIYSLNAMSKGITSLSGIETLKNATSLRFTNNNLYSLAEDTFSGLDKLQNLYLSNTKLSGTLATGLFRGLTGLINLYINTNNLVRLPDGIFSGLINLQNLYINENLLTGTLNTGLFQGLNNLYNLDISKNALTGIPEQVFSGLLKIQTISLRTNQLGNLFANTFQGLTGITQIDIGDNKLITLPNGIFSGLNNIGSLYLFSNLLTGTLPTNIFEGLSKMTYLNISSNKLGTFQNGLFSGLTSVQFLYLNNNQITGVLDKDIFQGLTNLANIYLNSNQITGIPKGTFSGLNKLSNISFYSNQISGVLDKDLFQGLTGITTIDFSNNKITAIPTGIFSGLKNINSIYFYLNEITGLDINIFQGTTGVTNIDFRNNKISDFPVGIFSGLNKLSTLNISNNLVTNLDSSIFQGLGELTNLQIQGNQIQSLPSDIFSGLSKLSTLYLYTNKLLVLPAGIFSGLSNLSTLNFGSNLITGLNKKIFEGLGNLTYLQINSNKIRSLPSGIFSGLNKIGTLFISDMSLKWLPHDIFKGLTLVTYMQLGSNQLRYLPPDIFSGLNAITNLNLAQNCLNPGTLDTTLVSYITGKNSGIFPSQAQCLNTTTQLLSDPDYIENELLWAGFQEGTGSLKVTDPTTYVGKKSLDISEVNGNITVPMILQSSGTSSTNTYEAEFASGTVVKDGSGNNYTGTLSMPVLKSTGVVTNASGSVLSVASFGGSTPLFFDTGVIIRMPAPGRNNGDLVKILYSNSNWTTGAIQTYTTVTMINGVPYVEFSTTHFTDFAVVGFGTGTFVINNDDTVTNTKNVTLNIYNPNTGVQMRFSNDGTGWSAWENYGTSKVWTMSNGGGIKTVYVQFDSNADQVPDQTVSDSINYIPGGGEATSNEGDIIFTILTGGSYCIYGTTLDLGTGIVGTTVFSGNFMTTSGTNTWTCSNSNGASVGGSLTVQMSGDLVNENNINTKIGSGNVAISFGGTSFGGSLTGIVRSGSNIVLNQQVIVLGTTTTPDLRIGSMSTTGVRLQVTAPANQAPGRYQGTLVITLPW